MTEMNSNNRNEKHAGLISIIMPVYNTQAYLEECLDSILAQRYTDWEVLAVDDFSSDGSFEILQQYTQKDARFKIFKNKEKGIIPALQVAFEASKGNYITRMDSDDKMHPNKLEILKKSLDEHGQKRIAVGPVQYFADYEIGDGFKRYENWLNSLIEKGNNFEEIYKECVIPSPSWMCFRTDFLEADAFNPNRYPEDYDLVFRFYEKGFECIPETQLLHYWRDHQQRTSRNHHHYADQSFIDIKVHYFLKLNHDPNKKLLLWGAGNKGKRIAAILVEKEISFNWICDNDKKIGKEIYGVQLEDYQQVNNFEDYQSILTVANPIAKKSIEKSFHQKGLKAMEHYFYFC